MTDDRTFRDRNHNVLLKRHLLAIKFGFLVFRAPRTFAFTAYSSFLPFFYQASNATYSQKEITEIIDFQSVINFILRFVPNLDCSWVLLFGRSQIIDNIYQKAQNMWLLKQKSPQRGL